MGKLRKLKKLIETEVKKRWTESHSAVYDVVFERFQKIERKYSLEEVVGFAQKMLTDESQSHYVGYCLSALINQKITGEEEIELSPLFEPNGLGYKLPRGRIILDGDSGWGTGEHLLGGEIIVKGNARADAGKDMRAGTIVIKGDAKSVGKKMRGGKIIVLGNADDYDGNGVGMLGGMIVVMGKVEKLPRYLELTRIAGIIVEQGLVRKFDTLGWDISSISPLDRNLPRRVVEKVLANHMRKNHYAGWRALVEEPEQYESFECIVRFKMLDQELPDIIRKIGEPQKKLEILKMLEEETKKTLTKEKMLLAQACGANVQEAIDEYNLKIRKNKNEVQKEIKKLKREKKSLEDKLI